MNMPTELTIVVPTLNEEAALPLLLADLAAQKHLRFVLIISDGTSPDATICQAENVQGTGEIPILIIQGPAGRPHQIDRGAALATSRWLLILHADSRLPDCHALRSAVDQLAAAASSHGDNGVAGRFRLSFGNGLNPAEKSLILLEQKARLNRPGCIHGDQGIMLATDRYRALAPLPTDLPMLAETWLADHLLASGTMLLFPHQIVTSARRFSAEGLAARQTLNALIMNFATIGWPAFFTNALPLYREQAGTSSPLPLKAALNQIHTLLKRESPAERRRIWRATGGYVAANAWQLAFRLEQMRARSATGSSTSILDRYDRYVAPLVTSPSGQHLAQWLTWCWFQLARRRS